VVVTRKIIHVDADSFYASVEVRENSQLKGLPVAVGGPAHRRGVIATCNYEARSWGVKSAMPTAQAQKICPQLIVVAPRMELYRQASADIRAILQDYSEQIEPLSLDEAYLDVTGSQHCQGSATRIAEQIRQRVRDELQLVVSAGVGPNKFLAKIASDWRKPDGLFVVTPQMVDDFLLALPVSRLHGVGRVTAQKLRRLGIESCAQLQQFSQLELVRHFGKLGDRLWQLSRGIDERPVIANARRQSLSVEQTYPSDLPDVAACLQQLPALVASLQRRHGRLDDSYSISHLMVKIKFCDFSQTTLERAAAAINTRLLAQMLAAAHVRSSMPVRLLGIGVRLLDQQQTALQLNLPFADD